MRGVTLRQLRAFAVVAQQHSFARAAAELRLTPSAVSLQIKELELAVRLPLFERLSKSVSLTRAGELLLLDTHRMLAALDHADQALHRLRGTQPGRISVGVVSNAEYFVPRMLARFHEQRGDIDLSLSVGNREQLLEHLECGKVDLAIMGTPPEGLAARADSFAAQPLGIVAAGSHPLAGRSAISPSELAQCNFIVRESGSGTRSAMEGFFRNSRIEPPRVMEMSSNESIKQAVMANMGLAFLSLNSAALEVRAQLLVTLDIVGLPLLRPWYVVRGNRAGPSEAISSLRRFILDMGGGAMTLDSGLAGPAAF